MRTVGVVVNPIAGMGGRVGLKGTDGVLAEAVERGAEPRAPERAVEALTALGESVDVQLLAWGGQMGADAARAAGVECEVVGEVGEVVGEVGVSVGEGHDLAAGVTDEPANGDGAGADQAFATTAADTRAAVRAFVDRGVDLILFVGGDGTAVDVAEALAAAGATDGPDAIPVLGVPAGVKVYSGVFAVTPRAAGRIAATFDDVEPAEVADLDEAAYRDGEVRSTLRAVLRVPVAADRQASKELAGGDVTGLAAAVAEEASASPERTYLFGPGSTVGAIEAELDVDGSPLGVDAWRDGRLLVRDGNEAALLGAIEPAPGPVTIVVSPVGGQGFVLGRGNLQLSPAVVDRADELAIVASRRKLDRVGVLRVDTGDADLDESLRGWRRVRVGRFEHRLVEVA